MVLTHANCPSHKIQSKLAMSLEKVHSAYYAIHQETESKSTECHVILTPLCMIQAGISFTAVAGNIGCRCLKLQVALNTDSSKVIQ